MARHFIRIKDLGTDHHKVLNRALEMKQTHHRSNLLDGKAIALLFEKASTRTRMSFEVGIRQLGGQAIFMNAAESQIGRDEPMRDAARVISRYCDGMVVRTFGQEKLDELVSYSSIPVFNALTDQGHPCQVMSDVLTIYERGQDLSRVRVAWIGDGNNMAYSWMEAAIYFPFELFMACPKGFEPDSVFTSKCLEAGAKIFITDDPYLGVADANYVNTDVWTSMGRESERYEREVAFKNFCVNESLMELAAPDAKFMHCLPAHRGEEVSEEVLEGENSLVFDEAENRLHMQKAILEWAYGGEA